MPGTLNVVMTDMTAIVASWPAFERNTVEPGQEQYAHRNTDGTSSAERGHCERQKEAADGQRQAQYGLTAFQQSRQRYQ